ncbi:CHIT1 [Branchiostoma lanceolatum]|uniref:CHIT1 protein n=1 Tax=Branchiostoma lanceolatum TaxID=7740 RepID=A0A8K0AAZ1_BRALA|nr:CHIT1 [Branchiostoma lanceolatum]
MNMGTLPFLILLTAVHVGVAEYRVVCYYTNWAQYRRSPWSYVPENVDPNLCTHVIYAFANMEDNQLKPYEWNDEDMPWGKGMYSRVGHTSDKFVVSHDVAGHLLRGI